MEDEIAKMNSIKMKDDGRNTKVVTASIDKMTYADAEKQRLEKKMTRSRFYTEALKHYVELIGDKDYVKLPDDIDRHIDFDLGCSKHNN